MSKKWMILAALGCMMFYGCGDDSSGEDTVKACGNSQVEGDETCDDGNTESGDGCSADCLNVEDGYTCPKEGGACTKQDIPAAAECGNGKLEDGEACDDGNKSAGDGCSSDCRIEDGYSCETAGKACSKAVQCGNGKIESGEACDDGNSNSGDGCSSKCEIEDGYTCAAEGEPCTAAAECGNSKLDADWPATLSEKVINGHLRKRLGFKGVVVTDDLAMGAMMNEYSFDTILTRAILAGADILCLSNNGDTYDPEIAAKAIDIIVEKVKDGSIPESRIHESYDRIMELKKKIIKK